MKSKVLASLLTIAAFGVSAQGMHHCRVLEFAELNSMSKAELQSKYCHYQSNFDGAQQRARQSSQASVGVGQDVALEYEKRASTAMQDGRGCMDEVSRIGSMLVKKKGKLDCAQ